MLGGLHQNVRNAYFQAGMLCQLHLDLLYQCDLDCTHCYLDDKARPILRTPFWLDVIDQAAELSVFELVFSGGEVFLRKDALELMAHARKRGLLVHVKSHGGGIDDAVADRLAEMGVSTVAISYYSPDPAEHDAITRRPGSHAKTLAAMKRLNDRGVLVVAACVVMDQNRGSYPALVAQCEALGITVALDGEVRTALSGDRFPQDTGLDLDAMVAFEKFKLSSEGGCTVPSPANSWGAGKNCIAGVMALYVSPEGQLMPCVTWPEALGDLSKGDRLADLWHGAPRLREIKGHTRDDREICRSCPVRQDCDFCMGQAFVETGDPYSGITTLCLTTRAKTLARARATGQPDPPLPAGLVRLEESAPAPQFRILNAAQVAALAQTGS